MSDSTRDPERLLMENEALRRRIAALELEAPRASEKQLTDTIVNSMPGIFYTLDFAGRFVRWNSNFERVTGYGGEELAAMSALELFEGEDKQRIAGGMQEVAAKGESTVEAEITNKAGRRTPYLFTGMRAEIGGVPHLIGMGIDVTDRKKTDEALRESAVRYQTLFNESTDGILIADYGARKFKYANPALCRMLGYTEDELKAMGLPDIHPKEAIQSVVAEFEALARGDKTVAPSVPCLRKDGSVFHADVGAVKITVDGTPCNVGFFRDITERKRAEEELRRHRDHLEELVTERTLELRSSKHLLDETGRLARVGGWEIDLVKNELSWSDVVRQIHEVGPGYRPSLEAAINYYAPEAVPVISEAVRRALEEGRSFDVELQLITAKQKRLWVRAVGEAIREDGKIAKVRGVFQDIDARKLAEDEIRKHRDHLEELVAQRTDELATVVCNLERSNQELEQFAYVASHDLQEPLRMVSSFTQLLAQRYEDKLDQDAKEFIGYAVDGANRMQRLIQDLLMYSRIATRGRPPEPLDAHDALGEAVRNLQVAIQETGALVTNDELPIVVGDHTQVAQVFQNLIGNAVKFHKPDEAPRVHVSAGRDAKHPGFWTFKVADNGIGIDPRHFERLFVIFQRLHGKREYPGTGIGLALCKRIVERHGGRIWLESEAGVGTTVFFTIPAAKRGKGAEQ